MVNLTTGQATVSVKTVKSIGFLKPKIIDQAGPLSSQIISRNIKVEVDFSFLKKAKVLKQGFESNHVLVVLSNGF